MPNREFLETYPLYRRFRMAIPDMMRHLDTPALHMECGVCQSGQTFNMVNEFTEFGGPGRPAKDAVIRAVYRCTACGEFCRYFFIKIDPEGQYMVKVGQEPPWEIAPDRVLHKALGENADFYKKGLVCESQGYGIGAFAYYRRVVEEVIDSLLSDIADLITGDEHEQYLAALERVKQTPITQDKIDLVKGLLPPILRPDGMNPLAALHDVLSEGLHRESDEHCSELAMIVRNVLTFLVNQIITTKTASASFTESMRRLLDRRQ